MLNLYFKKISIGNAFRRHWLFYACCFLLPITVGAQYSSTTSVNNSTIQETVREKVVLHVAKECYITGETVWFKLYTTTGESSSLSVISKVGYAELLDTRWKPVLQAKILLEEGTGNGSWVLPASLNSGQYLLTAYTKTTRSRTAIAKRWIRIINPLKPPVSTDSNNEALSVQFYPEGGTLVNGLKSVVGFRISRADGIYSDGEGAILNQHNDTIVRFKSSVEGIGRFEFTPLEGNSYKAILLNQNPSNRNILFPATKQKGMLLHLESNDDKEVAVSILRQESVTTQQINFRISSDVTLPRAYSAVLRTKESRVTLPTAFFVKGVNTIEAFDENGSLIAQRLIYRSAKTTGKITIQPSSTLFTTREKEKITLSTENLDGKAVAGSFSIAIYKTDSLEKFSGLSVNQSLLTNSLGAYMSNPGSYYNHDIENYFAIDNLLLAIVAKEAAIPSTEANPLIEYSGHIVTGKIVVKATGAPAKGIPVYLTVPGERFHFSNCTSDSNGSIQFDVRKIQGTENIIVQTNPQTDSIYRITIDNPFSKVKDSCFIPLFKLNADFKELWEERITQAQLQNAYQLKEQEDFTIPDYIDTTTFYGKPDNAYLLDDYTRFKTMEEVMREYVPEVQVRRSGGQYRYKVIDQSHHAFFVDNPLVLLDGVPIFDINKILAVDPLRIRKMDILSRRYYQGRQTFDGIVSYTTYTGDLGGYPLDATALYLDYPGLQLHRLFHYPVYQKKSDKESPLPDMRQLLYWSSDFRIDKTGKADLNFYTSDITGDFVIVVKGLDAEGNWYTQQYPFKVVH